MAETYSVEALQRELAETRAKLEAAENEKKAALALQASGLRIQVSQKGAISVYGLGKRPFTLYANQWERVLAVADAIRAFIAANGDSIATPDAPKPPTSGDAYPERPPHRPRVQTLRRGPAWQENGRN